MRRMSLKKNPDYGLEFSTDEYEEVTNYTKALDLSDAEKTYLEFNLWNALMTYHQRAYRFYSAYINLQIINVFFSAVTPLLAGLGAVVNTTPYKPHLLWATFAVGLVTAVTAGILRFARYGERWLNYRDTAQEQKVLGWHFILLTGPFAGSTHAEAYGSLVERLNVIAAAAIKETSGIVGDGGKKG